MLLNDSHNVEIQWPPKFDINSKNSESDLLSINFETSDWSPISSKILFLKTSPPSNIKAEYN